MINIYPTAQASCNLILVEDDNELGSMIKDYLGKQGVKVTTIG